MPRSAYLHVPFCRHRCGYCNFAVVAGRDDLVAEYLRAIEQELSWLEEPRPVETLYFGGGTPTRLPTADLEQLMRLADRWFPSAGTAAREWTVEANPGDIAPAAIASLAEHGATRLSLGVQSFRREKLERLERDHTPQQVHEVIAAARDAGLGVSIDLIFAAPGESFDEWLADLDSAIEAAPDHISTYGLTYEKGTSFWSRRVRGELDELEEDLQARMYEAAIDRVADAGFEHYEVSNHARPGRRSRHNEAYWAGQEYYAAGPGAARYVGGVRETNHRSTTTYLRRVLAGESPVAEREKLGPEQRARERLVFGLRRLEGIDAAEFAQATGYTIDELAAEPIALLIENGLLEQTDERIRLTRRGLLVSDAIWPELL